MSWYGIRMEQLVVGAALAGIEPEAEAAQLRSTDLRSVVAAKLYASVTAAPISDFGDDVQQAARFHVEQAGQDRAPLVTAQALAGFAADALDSHPSVLEEVYRQVLDNATDRAIDRRLDDIRYAPGNQHEPRVMAEGYRRLGEAVARRTSIVTLLGHGPHFLGDRSFHLGEDTMAAWDAEAPRPAGQLDNPRWLKAETEVLAGLMQHPAAMWTIGSWIDHTSFSSSVHRDVFNALHRITPDQYEPVDAEQLHHQMREDRHLGLAEIPAHLADPATQLAHLRDLANRPALSPHETAAAARDLLTWHAQAQLASHPQATATAAAQPLPEPPAQPITAAGPTPRP